MELITILSTIILVATISTFILSIGAYILYKIRSRREQKPLMHAVGKTKAELVTVHEQRNFEEIRQTAGRTNLPRVHLDELESDAVKTERRINNSKEKIRNESTASSKYVKYSTEGYSSFDKDRSSGDLQWK
jgi:uncharacterized ion transporter superfamily protein YfcC